MKKRFAVSAIWILASVCFVFAVAAAAEKTLTPLPAAAQKQQVRTVVLDAGHGGADGGAVSCTGALESEINLAVVLKLRDLFSMFGVHTVLTRDSDSIPYPPDAKTIREKKVSDQKARVQLIDRTANAFLISIHQNNYPTASPSGAQVLYAPTAGSQAFAERLQNVLISSLDPNNKRSAAQIPGAIFLMNQIHCPGVLVECGFLSNPAEEALLRSACYQLKLAAAVAACFLYCEYPSGGTNESENSVFLYGLRQ